MEVLGDPRTLQHRSKIAPGGFPDLHQDPNPTQDPILLPFSNWAALGALLAAPGAVLALPGPPGSHFRIPGASLWSFLGLFFGRFRENTKTLIFDDSCSENQGFCFPWPKSSQHSSKIALGHALAPLGLFWRLLAIWTAKKRPGRPTNGRAISRAQIAAARATQVASRRKVSYRSGYGLVLLDLLSVAALIRQLS